MARGGSFSSHRPSAAAANGGLTGSTIHLTHTSLPHLGETTLITDINPKDVENFITELKRKGLKNKTVKTSSQIFAPCLIAPLKRAKTAGRGFSMQPAKLEKMRELAKNA